MHLMSNWASLFYVSTLNLLGRREPSCSVIFFIKPGFEGIVGNGSERERAGNRESSQTTVWGCF